LMIRMIAPIVALDMTFSVQDIMGACEWALFNIVSILCIRSGVG
jgi:hypothetical protein